MKMAVNMNGSFLKNLLLFCFICPVISNTLWPIPSSVSLSGKPYAVSSALTVKTSSKSVVLERGITRYLKYIEINHGAKNSGESMLKVVVINVDTDNESLGIATSYGYSIVFNASETLVISADTPYGALYGLETLSQLIVHGALINSQITIKDQPEYKHRGLMLDTGRRFYPIELMYNILDGMSFVKLNVLHFHISDLCRFSVESKKYPKLRNNEQEIYTQEDVLNLIAYAKDRGIRVLPEVESSAHANGLIGLHNTSQLKFCNASGYLQLYNDPEGVTASTMKGILGEMMSLFTDEFFHLGLDETYSSGPCTQDAIKTLESELLKYVSVNKTSVAWEEALLSTKAALNDTVIQAWKSASIKSIVNTKRYAINSLDDHLYLNYLKVNLTALWTDIALGLSESEKEYLLGGEMAMWTDEYCFIDECYEASGKQPLAWWMYDPDQDAAFTQSISGIIWPRAVVGAGSFWNYQHDLKTTSADFLLRYTATNKRLEDRGVLCCPVGCSCDYTSRCGQPYTKTTH